MASQRELEIVIKPDGTVEITTRGIKGPHCKDVVEGIAGAIGEIKKIERTSEWYEVDLTETTRVNVEGEDV